MSKCLDEGASTVAPTCTVYVASGCLISEQKCQWDLSLKANWLGHFIDMENDMVAT